MKTPKQPDPLLMDMYEAMVRSEEQNVHTRNYLMNTQLILMAYAIAAKIPAKRLAALINDYKTVKAYEADLVAEMNKITQDKDKGIEDIIKKAKQ